VLAQWLSLAMLLLLLLIVWFAPNLCIWHPPLVPHIGASYSSMLMRPVQHLLSIARGSCCCCGLKPHQVAALLHEQL
jgi:hypothetical protein